VAQEIANGLNGSLVLIKPENLMLIVGQESEYTGGSRWRVRASFRFNRIHYNFVVTDPWIESEYRSKADGAYEIGESRLCISLAEIIGGSATKLVASVLTPDRAG
jgi:hypothetical protein